MKYSLKFLGQRWAESLSLNRLRLPCARDFTCAVYPNKQSRRLFDITYREMTACEKKKEDLKSICCVQSLSIEMSQNAFLRDACPIIFITTFSKMLFILTMRTFLGLINGNITRGKKLIFKLHNKICVLAKNGHDIFFIIK